MSLLTKERSETDLAMASHSQDIVARTHQFVMNTYNRLPVALVKGKGSWAWDADGKQYLDFFSGLAVNNLGHSHPRVVAAVAKQSRTLWHVSNVFYNDRQAELAELLVKNSFGDKVFFCNSGAEANEGAVKLARKYAKKHFGDGRFEVVTMKNSFHGRTLAMITATGQEKYQKGFEPLMPGFRYAEFGHIDSLRATVTQATCAVMIEPVQGEGGVKMASPEYFRAVRDFCSERGILLIFDEVQTGIGRTGRLFAYEHLGIEPDIMTLAKALASGLPIGAMVTRNEIAEAFVPGDHASTFGGNPLVAAAAKATLETILDGKLVEAAAQKSQVFLRKLKKLQRSCSIIREVRGLGLMIALDLECEARPIVLKCLDKGLLINAVQERTLRILPPLTVKNGEISKAVSILGEVMKEAAAAVR